MPMLFIHLRNSEYSARDEVAEFNTPEAARAVGVKGALSMATDEIGQGRRSTAVVVDVEQEDGTRLLTAVVAVSVSPLMAVELPDAMLP
ncbi:hypothetical protein P7D22_21880 [Lichenihabitans sp. Uapishka_5]|uniref:DUF6894 family protein n=1 Tax=Lichenihabitans sp. Uapishka_5 TaxID=3037302 RepID=UPI0029E8234A|nr:hypothetical protein [Lichenihabitans sp. Uapishka_5]MDX7953817.1 hypothetical protein [Lichenihabitans sp. Uapishka_5]